MKIGLSTFPTGGTTRPGRLAAEAEARGFESVWFAEHSHIPVERRSAWGGGDTLPGFYYEVLDPVVAIADAAAGSTTIQLGFGIALLAQRDLIQFAKSLASLDALSDGRVKVGVGAGWNIEEMENHGTDPGTRFRRIRESVEALRVLLTEDQPEYHGRIIDFDPVVMLPKPTRCPEFHIAGAAPRGLERAIRYGDGWIPLTGRGDDDFVALAEKRRRAEEEAGRRIEFTVYAAPGDPTLLDAYREAGIDRVLLLIFPGTDEQTIAQLDQYAPLLEGTTPS
jgi:probable F420-dependent oxidoreductase